MSLGIAIKGPEGIVLAAESRVTLTAATPDGSQIPVNYDNASKLLSFQEPNASVGVVTYGLAAIGFRTASSFVPEFEASLPKERLSVFKFATRLSQFFRRQWRIAMPKDYQGPSMVFVVAGYDKEQPYGRVFQIEIPGKLKPAEHHKSGFGLSWGGQREMVDRLTQGYDSRLLDIVQKSLGLEKEKIVKLKQDLAELQLPVPLQAMALQDCVDLAIFYLRTTIDAQNLSVMIRGCGGPIEAAIITRREGLSFVQRKKIIGELGISGEMETA